MEIKHLHHHTTCTLACSPALPFHSSTSTTRSLAIVNPNPRTLFPALLTLFRQEMLLFIRLPVKNRQRSQYANGPVMNDTNLCLEMLAVPIGPIPLLVRTPYKSISVAHLMQQDAEHGRDGFLSIPVAPLLQQNGLRIHLDAALSRLAMVEHCVS